MQQFIHAWKLIAAGIFLFACNGAKDKTVQTADKPGQTLDTGNKAAIIKKELADSEISTSAYYVWEVDFAKKTMKRNAEIEDEEANIDSVISGLNTVYKNISLRKVKLSHDTLFLHIDDSDYLTQKMGTTGSSQYLAQTVINLVSVKGVRFVNIDFEEGDHASPGTWSKEDFADYKVLP